ncbi:alpha/beta fold hydrolase [Metabacillus litoralis]|uniref:alpha/beta fold hydrolase n=1 Tax=Metabacillus litoralis TaxID=152268 RepID=UPI001CFEA48B|nr:alpha/beta hydrolase [Metabacillus litoralis]
MERYTHNVGENMISYTDQGVGHCVVLIHGFCGDSHYWKYIVPHLVKKNRVLTVDLRGHGDSSTPKNDFEITDFADDISSLLTSLRIERATLIGHSLGGYISLAFAEKYPDKLCGLSLVHSTALPDTTEAKENRENGIQKITKNGIKPFIDELVPNLFSMTNREELEYQVKLVKNIGYGTSEFGAIGALNAMKNRPNRNEVLQDLIVPILLVAGSDDEIIPQERTFSVENDNMHQAVIENSGHMSMLEQPDKLVEVLQSFLEGVIDSKME